MKLWGNDEERNGIHLTPSPQLKQSLSLWLKANILWLRITFPITNMKTQLTLVFSSCMESPAGKHRRLTFILTPTATHHLLAMEQEDGASVSVFSFFSYLPPPGGFAGGIGVSIKFQQKITHLHAHSLHDRFCGRSWVCTEARIPANIPRDGE